MEDLDLTELRSLAIALNTALSPRFDQEQQLLGGDLFLGRSYKQTSRIFLSYNPGGRGTFKFKTGLCDINFWDHPDSGYRFWSNCRSYINAVPELHGWMDLTAVGFCSPWRTVGEVEFKRLNNTVDGELYKSSGKIVRMLGVVKK